MPAIQDVKRFAKNSVGFGQFGTASDRWDRCKLGIKAHKCFLTESARQTRNEAKPNIVTESVPGSEHTPGILV